MENATKALLIAAGVLVGIILLSLGVYMFNMMGEFSAKTQERIDGDRIAQFNAEFMQYNGLQNLTIQDIVTVKNYALQNNNQYTGYNVATHRAASNNDYIDVYIIKKSGQSKLILDANDEVLLKENMDKVFSCTVTVNTNNGKVNLVKFKEL